MLDELMCFYRKLPREEIRHRFGDSFNIEIISTKTEANIRRGISVYLMEKI